MLSSTGRAFMEQAPWLATSPGLAISLAVLAFNPPVQPPVKSRPRSLVEAQQTVAHSRYPVVREEREPCARTL